MIKPEGKQKNIPYISPKMMRTLVRVATNLGNDSKDIIADFQNKLSQYTSFLVSATLSPSDLMTGYNTF